MEEIQEGQAEIQKGIMEQAEAAKPDDECGDIKHGGVDIACRKQRNHVMNGDLWHGGRATIQDVRTIESTNVVKHVSTSTTTELVEWMDPLHQASERLKKSLKDAREEAEKEE